MAAFVDAVVYDRAVPVTGLDGRVPVVMALAARKSLVEHRPVRLSEIEDQGQLTRSTGELTVPPLGVEHQPTRLSEIEDQEQLGRSTDDLTMLPLRVEHRPTRLSEIEQ